MCRIRHKITNKGTPGIMCFVLAVALFLAGMYTDAIMSDVLFVCDSMGKTSSCLRSCHTDINDVNVCIAEMLNECSSMEWQPYGRHRSQEGKIGSLLYFLYANLGSSFRGDFWACKETIQSFCQVQNELLTDYIHRSDGKKRI